MTRGVKVAIALVAILGFIIGSWVTTLFIPTEDGGCESISPTTTRCTLDPIEPWRWLVGGVPVALILASSAVLLVRRHERRSRNFAKPS